MTTSSLPASREEATTECSELETSTPSGGPSSASSTVAGSSRRPRSRVDSTPCPSGRSRRVSAPATSTGVPSVCTSPPRCSPGPSPRPAPAAVTVSRGDSSTRSSRTPAYSPSSQATVCAPTAYTADCGRTPRVLEKERKLLGQLSVGSGSFGAPVLCLAPPTSHPPDYYRS